ncbi:MAG TPA: MBL fold metallo-hydrolase [Tenuifilaceae bacterium]|nr:MBL fold metallo-hydrolase [Tenuifilaceae bacterium]HPI45723.1 MBL fold metallo-hydrolase [Tenuifilaceae bacterium]HPN22718.1 MBL fold metallo-hydrolase [Tenuifilaceae bacterium]
MKLTTLRIDKVIDNESVVIFPVLLQNENSSYLVDCGYEETFDELCLQLKRNGLEIKDLTGVIITHDDYDHLEGLRLLKQKNSNLKVNCGIFEKDAISGIVKSERLIQAEELFHSTPDEYKTWSLNFINKLKRVPKFDVDRTLADNEYFESNIIVKHTPGHTQGHISLFYTQEKTLIAGDAIVIENGKLNIANPQFTLNMALALKSVEKIKNLKPKKIICYHGGIIEQNIDKELDELIEKYRTYAQPLV